MTDPALGSVHGVLKAVATPTPTTMVAVGFGSIPGGDSGALIVAYDGTSWSTAHHPSLRQHGAGRSGRRWQG